MNTRRARTKTGFHLSKLANNTNHSSKCSSKWGRIGTVVTMIATMGYLYPNMHKTRSIQATPIDSMQGMIYDLRIVDSVVAVFLLKPTILSCHPATHYNPQQQQSRWVGAITGELPVMQPATIIQLLEGRLGRVSQTT